MCHDEQVDEQVDGIDAIKFIKRIKFKFEFSSPKLQELRNAATSVFFKFINISNKLKIS